MHLEDGELRSNEPGSFNHREWLEKLSQNVRREKVSSKVGYILGGGGGGLVHIRAYPFPHSPLPPSPHQVILGFKSNAGDVRDDLGLEI